MNDSSVERVELGAYATFSRSQSLLQCGLILAALGQAITKIGNDSPYFSWVVSVMILTVVASLFGVFLKKSITAVSSPKFLVVTQYSLGSWVLARKERLLDNTAWVRVRYDGYQQVFVEVGTRAYEVTNLLRVAYLKGAGIDEAQTKAGALAKIWGVECKRQVVGSE